MRDWGYAKDYVEAMWLALQQEKPSDFVIASGESHTVREFAELAFKEAGIELEWRGRGLEELIKQQDKYSSRLSLVTSDPVIFPIQLVTSVKRKNAQLAT